MSKIKMKCISCGKWFQSANAKEVTCPECAQKARKEKLAAKNAPPAPSKAPGSGARPTPPSPPKPKPAGGSGHWFDNISDVKVGQPDQPTTRPKLPSSPASRDNRSGYDQPGYRDRGPGGYRDRDQGGYRNPNYRDERSSGPGGYRGPGSYRDERSPGSGPGGYRDRSGYRGSGTLEPGYRPRQPGEGDLRRGPRPDRPDFKGQPRPPKAKPPREPKPTKPKREKIPPPTPFVPTPEQLALVEARYQELATPQEFDGIRTQISKELSIPKKAVKKIVQEFRERNHIPSWWETQSYKGSSEELEKIKAAYLPYLPVPAIGIHKKIADELLLKPGEVYQAIKAIRLEMNLPQFNDPTLHGEELAELQVRRQASTAVTAGSTTSASEETAPDGASPEPPQDAAREATDAEMAGVATAASEELEAAPAATETASASSEESSAE